MSRNLLRTECYFCGHEVSMVEKPRLITHEEARVYFNEYAGMTVANAECGACEAQYLAWVAPPPGDRPTDPYAEGPFYDLSFRSTFNDEPGDDDMPRYDVKKAWQRVGPYTGDRWGNRAL